MCAGLVFIIEALGQQNKVACGAQIKAENSSTRNELILILST